VVLVVVFGRRVRARNPVEINKGKRSLGQVAFNDPAAGIFLLPGLDGGIAELARVVATPSAEASF
jgi:hypothetical protein